MKGSVQMALYAISDLHLAMDGSKPMDIFGENWIGHDQKIRENWENIINNEDSVLIAGDISWSVKMKEGMKDLDWINTLPGKKFIVRGNHDYWWEKITKLNKLYANIKFIQNNFFTYEDYAICGSRGWSCPGGENFTIHDDKIYKRELLRLELSIDAAVKAGYKKYIVMLHFPPTNEKFEDSGFTEIFKKYGVEKVIYGHIHGPSLKNAFTGNRDGAEFILTSCDYIDFAPIKIM
jgi:uncharacterized protein